MPEKDDRLETLPQLDVVIASLCYLMSRYVHTPSVELANAVSEHFELLMNHPHCDSVTLKDTGRRLGQQWHMISRQAPDTQGLIRPHYH